MKLILKNGMSVLYKDGMGLTGMNIVSIVADSKEDRFNLRMLLTGGLKVDKEGCYPLALGLNGSNASSDSKNLATNFESKYSLEEKLRIIDALTSVIQRNEPMLYEHTREAEVKLLALVQSI